MLLSVAVYLLLALILFMFGWHLTKREQRRLLTDGKELPFYSWEIIASIIFLSLVVGLRYNTGSDYMLYLSEFFSVKHHGHFSRVGGMECGFEAITRAFVAARLHFTLFFIFWAAVHATLMYYGLRHHKHLIPWFVALLILGMYSYNWLSFMRQWVVTFTLLALLPLVSTRNARNFLIYAVFVVLASTIHLSALALLPLYFIPFKYISQMRQKVLIIIFAACVLIGQFPMWVSVFKPLFLLLPKMGYERYSDMLTVMLNGGYRWIAWGPLHFIVVFCQVVFIWYYPVIQKKYSHDSLLPVVFSFAFLGACYEAIMTNTVHFLLRPADLTYACILMAIAYVCHYMYEQKKTVQLVVFLIVALSYTLINVAKIFLMPEVYTEQCVLFHFFMFR